MAKSRPKVKTPTIYVDIVLDIVCPWCWLGAAYFHKAVEQYNGKVELNWRPYMLDPTVPPEGVPYRHTIIIRPNTLNAHRLIRWAQGQGKANAMSEALFKAAFTDNLDIGNHAILSKLAGQVGLEGALVRDLLETDKDSEAVQNEILHFRNLGVSGVPTFIYNGQFAVQGAQPVDTHLKAFAQAAKTPLGQAVE